MILADLHNHTCYSHARDSVRDMYQSAVNKGLSIFGFSEHSPRPERFTYTHEYRERLNAHLGDYVREVQELKRAGGPCRVLFGMEIDWFESDPEFVKKAATQFPFDYLIGSVHFLGTMGFDDKASDWECLDQSARFEKYDAYFRTILISSKFFPLTASIPGWTGKRISASSGTGLKLSRPRAWPWKFHLPAYANPAVRFIPARPLCAWRAI